GGVRSLLLRLASPSRRDSRLRPRRAPWKGQSEQEPQKGPRRCHRLSCPSDPFLIPFCECASVLALYTGADHNASMVKPCQRKRRDPAALDSSIMEHVIRAARDTPGCRCGFLLATFLLVAAAAVAADQPASADALWKKLEPFAQTPEEFAGKFGSYRSPLKFADGAIVKSAADWARRRDEILKTWHKRLGPWPPLVERPVIKKLEKVERAGYTEHRVQVQASP